MEESGCLCWAPSVLTDSLGPCPCPSPMRCRRHGGEPVPWHGCATVCLQPGAGAGRPRQTARARLQQGCTIIPHPPPSPVLRAGQGDGTGRRWHIQGDALSPRPPHGAHRGGGICSLRKCLYLPYVPGWSLEAPLSLVPKVRSSAPQSLVGGSARDTPVHL